MNDAWGKISDFISNKKKIAVITHTNPDGDGIGSQVAFSLFLEQLGKEPIMINSDPLPQFFQFLDPDNRILLFDDKKHRPLLAQCEGVILVDVYESCRVGQVAAAIEGLPVAVIDHHLVTSEPCDIMVTNCHASSTGEIIFELIKQANGEFTQLIVDGIYTSILTDTGSFRFSNTTAQTHYIVAQLLEHGARVQFVYSQIYESHSKHRMWLMGNILANMHFERNEKIAWYVLTQELLKRTGAQYWESEGFSELSRPIKNVEISIMFTETEEGLAKASFRSGGRIPVNELAGQFGGGGHKFASGAKLDVPISQAIELVLPACEELVSQYE